MKREYRRAATVGFALAALPALAGEAAAQIAVSANDNKAVLVNGANVVPDRPAADTVAIIDLGLSPPKVIGEVQQDCGDPVHGRKKPAGVQLRW